jgi:hypothetical protein
MKTLRRLCAASVFTLSLALPVLAGEITTMVVQPPAAADGEISTGAPGEIQTTAPGEISTPGEIQTGTPGGIETGRGAVDPAQVALSLLQAVLPLL